MTNEAPPPLSPPPAIFTRAWFERYIPRGIPPRIIPQALQWRFPFSILVYVFLPLFIPTAIFLVFLNFAIKTRSSRLRIRLLEEEASNRKQKALVHVLSEIDQEVEEAFADLIDSSDPIPVYPSKPGSSTHPIICSNHQKIAAWLNTLPLHKEFAYFEKVRNSHGMIVCRDVQNYDFHRLGEPLLRHFANHFVM